MDTKPRIAQKQWETETGALPGRTARRSAGLRLFGAALLGASLLVAGCDSETSMRSGAPAGDVTGDAGEAAVRLAEKEKIEFLQASQQQLEEAKAHLETLKRELDSGDGAAKEKLQGRIAELERKWNVADAKVAALKAQSPEAWAQNELEVVAALADLKASYRQIRRTMVQG